MNTNSIQKNRKKIMNLVLFLGIMGLTFYAVFHGQNPRQLWDAIRQMSVLNLSIAFLDALFFVSAEGCMIWYLLRSMNGKTSIFRCIGYSFIGFFYSGITPSATGGQPMQLYYMKKDNHSLSDSSVVLMTVALIYKFVLVVIGGGLLLFWYAPLKAYLQGYFGLYLLGLLLNIILVAALLAVMAMPKLIKGMISGIERILVRVKILKKSDTREEKINQFIDGYQGAVYFLRTHKRKVLFIVLLTLLQRVSVFFLTYVVYRGFSLHGTSMMTILSLQASVYIAVDMLPIPGAQGITELMYQGIFSGIFTGTYLMPSLCVTRGINFYFLLVVSLLVVIGNHIFRTKRIRQ